MAFAVCNPPPRSLLSSFHVTMPFFSSPVSGHSLAAPHLHAHSVPKRNLSVPTAIPELRADRHRQLCTPGGCSALPPGPCHSPAYLQPPPSSPLSPYFPAVLGRFLICQTRNLLVLTPSGHTVCSC